MRTHYSMMMNEDAGDLSEGRVQIGTEEGVSMTEIKRVLRP